MFDCIGTDEISSYYYCCFLLFGLKFFHSVNYERNRESVRALSLTVLSRTTVAYPVVGVNEGVRARRATNKRMDEEDYRKVEQELRRRLPKQNEPGSIVRVRQHAPSTSDDGLSSHPIGRWLIKYCRFVVTEWMM